MRELIDATSLHYLSADGMQEATTLPEDAVCRACFTREYPTRVPGTAAKLRFEPRFCLRTWPTTPPSAPRLRDYHLEG